jgi:RNA polymerase sigma-70 factor (ECF subfamily)
VATVDDSDSELMMRLARGDDLSLNALIDRWDERLAAFLHKMTGNHEAAVDLAQETFVKLYQARHRYRPKARFSTYLFAIASNLARNHARWNTRHPAVSLDVSAKNGIAATPEIADSGFTPAESALVCEKVQAVHEAFLLLPPDLREAMALFVYEGMGYAEIAKIGRCSVKAVETRIYRARQFLKDKLKEFR